MKTAVWMVAASCIVFGSVAGCSTVRTMTKDDQAKRASTADQTEVASKGTVEFSSTPEDLNRAIPEAMADLQMTYIRTRKDGSVMQIDGKTADQRNVSITIRPGLGTSKLSSRIGWFGDTVMSNALAERVGIRAGLLPPKPIPDVPPSSPDPNPIFSRSAVSDDVMFRDIVDQQNRDRVIP